MGQISTTVEAVIINEYQKAVQTKEMLSVRITTARIAGEIAEAKNQKELAVSWVRSIERILREMGFTDRDIHGLYFNAITKLRSSGQ